MKKNYHFQLANFFEKKRLSLIMPGVLPVMQKTTLAFLAQLNMKLMVGDLLKVFAVTAEQQ